MRITLPVVCVLLVMGSLFAGTGVVAAQPAATQPAVTHTAAQPAAARIAETAPTHPAEHDSCTFPVSRADATGETVTLETRPTRITTTNPSAAQTLWEIGARDRVVGVTQYASYLNGTETRTNVSAAGLGVDVERVVGTDPDLVIAPNASADQVDALRDAGLTVYHLPEATSVDDIEAKTATIGRLVGACEAAAQTNAEMAAAVEQTRNRTADSDRPTALYPLGGGFVAGGETFITEVMEIGGLENAAADRPGYPQLSAEVVLTLDPTVLLVTDPDAPLLDSEPYASTAAGQADRVIVVEVQWLNQPAPRSVIEATDSIADGLADSDVAAMGSTTDAESTDAESTDAESTDADTPPTDGQTGGNAPGFGVALAVAAIVLTLLAATRIE